MADILVAEWIHFTLFGIRLPTVKLKVYTFGGLMNSATKTLCVPGSGSRVQERFTLQQPSVEASACTTVHGLLNVA